MNIFLSYTHKKDQFLKVSAFRDRLEVEIEMRSPGSRVFQDKKHLLEGSHFPEVLEAEINCADVLLILMSPAWLQSDWCRREFHIFTNNATDNDRLHKILPVLWVNTPELKINADDPVAKTIANINYSDWRDLRYESWDDSTNQRQVGRLAAAALALNVHSSLTTVGQTTPQAIEDSKRSDRLSTGEEAILLALNGYVDGLAEDRLVQLSRISQTRATVYLRKLRAEGYLRSRYTPWQQISEWVLCEPGENYLVHHDLVA